MKKLFILISVTVVILGGCGTTKEDSNTENQHDSNSSQGGIVAGEMKATLVEENPLQFTYSVKNDTEKVVNLEFTSSQRIDYSVSTKAGKEIYLFSSTATFLTALGSEEIKQGESYVHKINLNELSLDSGDYVLSVWMTPKEGEKFKTSIEFEL
ncbi:BsuPI-related putative proteinase inhibitor [Bacillus weihaiensis]|uniref:Intracellular proteinase inhibitor BsuPI domain-containing protein n=1 Tax=Bacillus weihaiensis TaxID=1547283 RepID=A0A1L3MQ71_9BACI|nr:BsuPI-related putative proteinase inhibitor [Bacillus weihaiensis]APH04488.1 hypothetical protein A9C19_06850 [Bacillus weihaiensis]